MAFMSIFKKASSLLGFSSPSNLKPLPLDGEIVFCKNNVCVHPPVSLTDGQDEHHQGYLTLRSTQDKVMGPALILTWIPNSTLKKNSRSIENSPKSSSRTTPRCSPRRTPRQEFAKPDNIVSSPTTCMTDLSPLDSSMSFASDLDSKENMSTIKKLSAGSVISDLSLGSHYGSVPYSLDDESQRELSYESNSKLDSGTASLGEELAQNNHKYVGDRKALHGGDQCGNESYAETVCEINSEICNLTQLALECEAGGGPTEFKHMDTSEATHKIQINGLQTHTKSNTSSNRSISIEMEGDNICITTEEFNDDTLDDAFAIEEQNGLKTNCNSLDEDLCDANVQKLCSDHTGVYCVNSNVTGTDYVEDINEETVAGIKNDSHESESRLCTSATTEIHEMLNSMSYQHPQSLNLSVTNAPNIEQYHTSMVSETSIKRQRNSSNSSTTTSGPDSEPPSPYSSSPTSCQIEPAIYLDSPSSADSVCFILQYPENSVDEIKINKDKKSNKEHMYGVFSVDLGQMRSIRVFYSDPENTRGQIVIASWESQYKILHFHNGGLDKLAEIFQDWNLFASKQDKLTEAEKHYKQFMIVKPSLTDDQCHPNEGMYSMVTEDIWHTHMMDDGVVEDEYQLRKAIFFGSIEPSIRHEVWPFLLYYFPFDSTFEEREHIRNDKYIEYQNIRKKRESMTEEEQQVFCRVVQCTVEKDVVRTDRSHPYFKGENNPNLQILTNILLNYAVANPKFGYTQGMSDLLAPVLAEVQKEVDTYWCFVGLMQKTIFVSSPKDSDMDKQLMYLRELLRLMQPKFYEHLHHLGDDAMELLFAHRWILLCFKREFNEKAVLRIWESCWAHFQTDYFHLFICVAIVAIYGEDVLEQGLSADDILLHFSSLACHMNGELVLRKARGLLHEYRRRLLIPCTLHGLCSNCGQGMWDSSHIPTVECMGNHPNSICPYLSTPSSPVSEDK